MYHVVENGACGQARQIPEGEVITLAKDVSLGRFCDTCRKRVVLVTPDPAVDSGWRALTVSDTVAFCSICHEVLGEYAEEE